MNFALKILGKYGWKEGEGLGKNSNGIAKPLKATLKFDNAGFGADLATTDFNNRWWERVFNEAASSVDVKRDGETIKMDLKDVDGVEISTKGYSMKKLKKAKRQREGTANVYHNFLQAATLTNLGREIENPNEFDASDIEVTKFAVLTDDELFKACGGRTAHKGARHGLKLSGKLSRIEQQEQEMEKIIANRNVVDEAYKKLTEETVEGTKLGKLEWLDQQKTEEPIKKKKKRFQTSDETVIVEECKNEQNNETNNKKEEKFVKPNIFKTTADSQETRKCLIKKKKNFLELETFSDQAAANLVTKKKKKNRDETVSEDSFNILENKEINTKNKKKNKGENDISIEESTVEIVSKKKKKCINQK